MGTEKTRVISSEDKNHILYSRPCRCTSSSPPTFGGTSMSRVVLFIRLHCTFLHTSELAAAFNGVLS